MPEILDIFQTNGADEVYCSIKDEINPRCQEAKVFVNQLWQLVHNYLDPDLPAKLPNQFHQHFWEIYLADLLLKIGLNLDYSNSSDGPDICIKCSDSSVWVEAVTALAGDGVDAVQKADFDVASDVPDDQIKLRLLNSFDKKSKKYEVCKQKNWVDSKDPYIIAINDALVPSARCKQEIPRIVRSLLPFGDSVLHLDKETLHVVGTSYEYQGKVVKASGNGPETTYFLNPKFSGISAVIYSCADVFNYPTDSSQSLLLLHNPLAVNPLPLGFLKKGHEYWIDDQYDRLRLSCRVR
jgi:type I restriction enzyme S subunit